jgi:hypothetical protein
LTAIDQKIQKIIKSLAFNNLPGYWGIIQTYFSGEKGEVERQTLA